MFCIGLSTLTSRTQADWGAEKSWWLLSSHAVGTYVVILKNHLFRIKKAFSGLWVRPVCFYIRNGLRPRCAVLYVRRSATAFFGKLDRVSCVPYILSIPYYPCSTRDMTDPFVLDEGGGWVAEVVAGLRMNCARPTDFTFSFTGFARKRGGITDKHSNGCVAASVQAYPCKTWNMLSHICIRYATSGPVALENVWDITGCLYSPPHRRQRLGSNFLCASTKIWSLANFACTLWRVATIDCTGNRRGLSNYDFDFFVGLWSTYTISV